MTTTVNAAAAPLTSGPVLAHAVLRVILGVNMFMHGAVRLFGDWSGFAEGVQKTFAETILPSGLVLGFAYAIPVVELAVGALLLVGLATRWALVAGGLLIASLIFGQCLLQNWSTVGTQMIYALAFFALLHVVRYDRLSIDGWRAGRGG